jgi:hypothetical protein
MLSECTQIKISNLDKKTCILSEVVHACCPKSFTCTLGEGNRDHMLFFFYLSKQRPCFLGHGGDSKNGILNRITE